MRKVCVAMHIDKDNPILFTTAISGGVVMITMKLTNKELEIMTVLWDSKSPMTATEIIDASQKRSWKETSIYIIMNTLLKKGAVALTCYKPTGSNTARAYEPLITSEDYTFSSIKNIMDAGVRIDISVLVERLMNESKG